MKEEIKNLRVKIDGLSQLVKELNPMKLENPEEYGIYDQIKNAFPSQEVLKSIDSLLLAKAWLGKILGELGIESPYVNDGNRKTVEDIEPTADTYSQQKLSLQENSMLNYFSVSDGVNIHWSEKPHIEKVDWLREEIKNITEQVTEINTGKPNFTASREFAIARTNAYNHLCEARFHLGFELERIREESK